MRSAFVAGAAFALFAPPAAADFQTLGEPAVLYDAPSVKAKPLFVLGRDTPVELIVPLEGWTKVRDATGTIGWVERKALATDRHMVAVRAPLTDVRAAPEDGSPIVFRAEQNVVLEVAEPVTSATATANPGWVKVRHRDGQTGYVRVAQIFGL